MACLTTLKNIGIVLLFASSACFAQAGGYLTAFVAPPILGRPENRSIVISIVPAKNVQLYYEFGTQSAFYSGRSDTLAGSAGVPARTVLTGLSPDTRYFYRLRFREGGAGDFLAGEEFSFVTQRAKERSYTFAIEADPHPYDKKGSHTLWPITLRNVRADSADFLLDLGDTFGDDHNPTTITSEELRQLHLDDLPYFGQVCHSSPLFLCLGNHEGESGYYLLQNPPDNLGVNATLWRKYYYANPVPDSFYTGNEVQENFGIGLPENYYAWEWGNALFVVLDSYRGYTANAKPRGWDWTLGKSQYDWFTQVLSASHARFKFVFAHHTLGETRGGVATAALYEWGGREADGTTWGFTANRPGWESPIHQLMVKYGVTIFFQGHDHLFAREVLDGIVYQEVPMPSDSTYVIGMNDNGGAYTAVKLDGSGHLRVAVTPDSVKVDYVESRLPADEDSIHQNGRVAYTYTVPTGVTHVNEEVAPSSFCLEQNFPNPFNPVTTIKYTVGVAGGEWQVASAEGRGAGDGGRGAGNTRLVVYDLLGREVAMLVNEEKATRELPGGVRRFRTLQRHLSLPPDSGIGALQSIKMLLIR